MHIDRLIEDLFAGKDAGATRVLDLVKEENSLRTRFCTEGVGEFVLRLSPQGSADPHFARIEGFDVVTLNEPPPGKEAAFEDAIRDLLDRIVGTGATPTTEDWRETLGGKADDRFVFGDIAEVKITRGCDQKCLFCKSPPGIANLVDPDEAIDVLPRLVDRARFLSISGGEPTLSTRLDEVVARAREAGFGQIEVQTNGMNFARSEMVDDLAAAGMNIALISLHASTPELSDELTATPGGFERTLRGIDNCLRANVDVSLCHVICKSNAGDLSSFGSFVRKRFDGHRLHVVFTLSLPHYRARSNPGVMPPLADVTPGLIDCLHEFTPARAPGGADTRGHVASVMHGSGLPMCVMGDCVEYHDEYWQSSCTDPTTELTFLPRCDGCTYRERCSGLWKVYLDLYGDEGIEPVRRCTPPG